MSAFERKMRVARDEFIFHITSLEQERVKISTNEHVNEIAFILDTDKCRAKTRPQV